MATSAIRAGWMSALHRFRSTGLRGRCSVMYRPDSWASPHRHVRPAHIGCGNRIAIGLIHRQESARRCTRPKQRSMRFSQVPGKPIRASSRGVSYPHALVNTTVWDGIEECCHIAAISKLSVRRTLFNPHQRVFEFHSVFSLRQSGFPHLPLRPRHHSRARALLHQAHESLFAICRWISV